MTKKLVKSKKLIGRLDVRPKPRTKDYDVYVETKTGMRLVKITATSEDEASYLGIERVKKQLSPKDARELSGNTKVYPTKLEFKHKRGSHDKPCPSCGAYVSTGGYGAYKRHVMACSERTPEQRKKWRERHGQ